MGIPAARADAGTAGGDATHFPHHIDIIGARQDNADIRAW